MAFSEKVVTRALLRARWVCEACGKPIRLRSEAEMHSANTLHLDLDPGDQYRYIVTSPPPNHEVMRGKTLPVFGFRVYALGRPDDAFCLCLSCHDLVHMLADSRMPGGRNAIPNVLEDVTIRFVATRGKMTF